MSPKMEQALELIREDRPEAIEEALALLQNTVYILQHESVRASSLRESRLLGTRGQLGDQSRQGHHGAVGEFLLFSAVD